VPQKLILAGDLNCEPDDETIRSLTVRPDGEATGLKNLTAGKRNGPAGTYRFQGRWELLDQIIVSERLLGSISGLYIKENSFRIFNPEFLLRKDPKYPGTTPSSTYRGYRYQGGFSDHLPVMIDLSFR
jgi:endonuclease/exonuclease/phosphatase family metal-dependent hydrolase